MRDFRKYEVWNDSMTLCEEVYSISKSFPEEEKFGLISQIRRAVISIPSNISEGASRTSEKEFSRYLEIAQGSVFEVMTQLDLAARFQFIKQDKFIELEEKLISIAKQLSGLKNKLK